MTTDRPNTSADDVTPGDAPIPNPGLDTLRKQTGIITKLSFLAMPLSLLEMTLFALAGGTTALYGIMFGLLLVATMTSLAIIMRILLVIRGGSLHVLELIYLGLHILFAAPSWVGFAYFMVTLLM